MNKRGFTLIELLAVIVILAIIALIAVPIVINIIDDSKKNSTLRSGDFYLSAVENSIAQATLKGQNIKAGTYNIMNDGNICLETYDKTSTSEACTDDDGIADNEILKVEVNGEVPKEGKIVINSGNISSIELKYKDDKTIVKNFKGELIYKVKLNDVCVLQEGSTENTIGAKYECDFGGGKRNFYILELGSEGSTLESDEVALILEGNYDTTTQPWCASGSDNKCAADGLTSKLDEIAGVWTKLGREQIVLPSALQIIVANDPSKNTIAAGSVIQSWLYNWPDNPDYFGYESPYGYWTSTPHAEHNAWYVAFNSYVGNNQVVDDYYYGVRPVVNLKI